jgi:hypothetical protein
MGEVGIVGEDMACMQWLEQKAKQNWRVENNNLGE